ncbi:MAG: hypothetical protein ACRBDL_01425 [Alphaproteobacteria bacterium]
MSDDNFDQMDQLLEMFDDLVGDKEGLTPLMQRWFEELAISFDRWESSFEEDECDFLRQYISDYQILESESALNNLFADMRGTQAEIMKRFVMMQLDDGNIGAFPDAAIDELNDIILPVPQHIDLSNNEREELEAFHALSQKDRRGMEIPHVCSKLEQSFSAHLTRSLILELRDMKERVNNNVVAIGGEPSTWGFE